MTAAGVDVSDVGGALEQIAYTADEIEALIPLLRRVPAPVLGMPLGSQDTSWSIAAAFAASSARDSKLRELLEESSTEPLPGSLGDASSWKAGRGASVPDTSYEAVVVVLANVVSGRRELVQALRSVASSVADGKRALLGARLFELIHDDAEIMREIAYALHSGPVTGELGE